MTNPYGTYRCHKDAYLRVTARNHLKLIRIKKNENETKDLRSEEYFQKKKKKNGNLFFMFSVKKNEKSLWHL